MKLFFHFYKASLLLMFAMEKFYLYQSINCFLKNLSVFQITHLKCISFYFFLLCFWNRFLTTCLPPSSYLVFGLREPVYDSHPVPFSVASFCLIWYICCLYYFLCSCCFGLSLCTFVILAVFDLQSSFLLALWWRLTALNFPAFLVPFLISISVAPVLNTSAGRPERELEQGDAPQDPSCILTFGVC